MDDWARRLAVVEVTAKIPTMSGRRYGGLIDELRCPPAAIVLEPRSAAPRCEVVTMDVGAVEDLIASQQTKECARRSPRDSRRYASRHAWF